MRLSVQPGDRAYVEPDATEDVKILLDGVEQKTCYTADEEEGYVLRAVRDEEGLICVDRSNGEILIEEVRGRVEIIRAA